MAWIPGTYVRRVVDIELDVLFAQLSALHLDGAKGVGKTATALQRAQTVWRLDRPEQAAIARASSDVVLQGPPPILLDEWHRHPPLWDAVKRAVDDDVTAGRFLLTGSSAVGTHSGAGRISSVLLRPLTLPERGASAPTVSLGALLAAEPEPVTGTCALTLEDYTDLILGSGFPGMQHLTGQALRNQLDGYVERIVERDMEEAGLRVQRPATVRAWLRGYAAATATTTSWDRIRDAATSGVDTKPAKSTVLPYRDVLGRLRILDDLEAWIPRYGHFSRLTQGPKHHLADPALAARLLGLSREQLLTGKGAVPQIPQDGAFLGALFESLATLTVRVFAAANEATTHHLRLRDGQHEVDLIVERPDGGVVALEVKLSSDVDAQDVKHLHWLKARLGDRFLDGGVLTTGSTAYRRDDGIAVIPLGLLGV